MGYTHYHPQGRDFTAAEWQRLTDAATKIVAEFGQGVTAAPLAWEYDEPTKPPQIDGDVIRFNGVGEDGHETFLLTRIREPYFTFCKTARKPYDVVVVAILIAADAIAPGALAIGSDGDADDWQAGLTLASRAIPTLAAEVPAEVRE